MGLSIGIQVKRQHEGYMSDGQNPKGTREQIEDELWKVLDERFPDGGFGLSVEVGDTYWFSVSFAHYAEQFSAKGYEFDAVYLALIEYILAHFSANYGIDMHVYFSA